MKIHCECGSVIVDQTDYLPNKGHIISDQDWFDFLEAIDAAVEKSGPSDLEKEHACMKVRKMVNKIEKLIYQCNECGNLYIDNHEGELEMFVKSSDQGNNILVSAYGANWRRPLIGEWLDSREGQNKGYIWCYNYEESFETWEGLEKRYYSVLKELKDKRALRSAILRKNYEIIHDDDKI